MSLLDESNRRPLDWLVSKQKELVSEGKIGSKKCVLNVTSINSGKLHRRKINKKWSLEKSFRVDGPGDLLRMHFVKQIIRNSCYKNGKKLFIY